jgi:predicted metal-dependent enzyme (double-stranded beta helix superfamily)
MHLFKEQAVRDYAAAAKAIPVIDYGPYFAGEKDAIDRLAAELADACENIGFFYALNHGVPEAVPSTRRNIRRRSTAISCSNSTEPITSTKMATAPQLLLRCSRPNNGSEEVLPMFDLDRFIADCCDAIAGDSSHKAVREILARAVADPAGVLTGLGEPRYAGVEPLYRSPSLTILNVVWGPRMTVIPHNHLMWAVIGVYSGREDNIFWRRLPAAEGSRIEAAGAKSLGAKDAEPLGRDIIHTVTNPLARLTGAIHVYGGDFYATSRSEWDPETLTERPYDLERNRRLFEDANRTLAAN